jgi:Zn-finger nucleic acid-binding protein
MRQQLATAHAAAQRVPQLEKALTEAQGSAGRVADLEKRLARAEQERSAALQRVAEIEKRLASSAGVAPHSAERSDSDKRLAAALAEKSAAGQRVTDLEWQLAAAQSELAQEKKAHAATRASATPASDAPAGPSPAEALLRNQVAELQSALQARDMEVRRLISQAASETLSCPRCGGKLIEFVHRGVTLDRCTACAGLFFDSGELQQVLRNEFPESLPAESTQAAAPATPEEPVKKKGFFRSLFSKDKDKADGESTEN